jgi:hypothetical protein
MTDKAFSKMAEEARKKHIAFAKDRIREEQHEFIIQAAIKTESGRSIDIIRRISEIIEEQLRMAAGKQPTLEEIKRYYRGERQYKRYISDLVKRGDLIRDKFDIIRPSDKLLERQEIRRLFAKFLGNSLSFICYPMVIKKKKNKEGLVVEEKISIAFGGKRQREEVIRQLVERIGLYAIYVFMKAVEPASTQLPSLQYNEEMRAFVKNAFDVLQPFGIFVLNTAKSYPPPKGQADLDKRYHVMDEQDYDSLERLLIGMYAEKFKELQHLEHNFYKQFPFLPRLKEKE